VKENGHGPAPHRAWVNDSKRPAKQRTTAWWLQNAAARQFPITHFRAARIIKRPMPSLSFIITGTVMSILLVLSGGLWAWDPKLFVRVYRRIARSSYVESEKWEQGMIGTEGRICGFVLGCAGFGLAYLLLRTMGFFK
jgi:hypothetical protein